MDTVLQFFKLLINIYKQPEKKNRAHTHHGMFSHFLYCQIPFHVNKDFKSSTDTVPWYFAFLIETIVYRTQMPIVGIF